MSKSLLTMEELHAKLLDEIPLTRHLGFEFIEASAERVRLRARLTENINHKGTAFGGSLYALGVLSAYSLVYMGVHRENVDTNNIVIQRGAMDYLAPVTGDFEVVCEHTKPEVYRRFFAALARWNKVRETFGARVVCEGRVCAKLEGVFVVRV